MKTHLLHYCILTLFTLFFQTSRLGEAQSQYNAQHYKEAITICSVELPKLAKTSPEYTQYLALRADSYAETNNSPAAIADYKTLIGASSKATYYISLSVLYGTAKNYKDCLPLLKTAVQKYPQNIPLLSNLSYFSNEAEKYDDGLKYATLGMAYTKKPFEQSAFLTNIGYAFLGQRKYEEALAEFNRAIGLNPNNSFAYCFRAAADIKLNRMATVCDDLAKSRTLGGAALTEQLYKDFCKH